MSVASRRIQAVVFDMDGLMLNTEELFPLVGGEVLRRRGHEITKALIDEMMGRPGRVSLQMMIDRYGLSDTIEILAAESDEVFVDLLNTRLAPMPGLLDLLGSLEAAGIPKAIGTSSGRSFVTDVLSRFDLERRFSFVLTAEDVTDGKPHPEIYLKAAARLGFAPDQVMVLEDSSNGCRAAIAAGAFAVAVPGDHSRAHDFTGASLRIDGLHDPRLYEALELVRA